ncbi:MAG TPA: hypothetical protein PKY50_06190 [Candidatus Competibacter sp.]|nr:hypothetical protein [Candidatus Competibacter sp.]
MVDIVVQRGQADRPAPDIVEPLLATVPAALARGKKEMDDGEQADRLSVTIPPADVRPGHIVTMIDPIAGEWVGKSTGIRHALTTHEDGSVQIETMLDLVVPRASRT